MRSLIACSGSSFPISNICLGSNCRWVCVMIWKFWTKRNMSPSDLVSGSKVELVRIPSGRLIRLLRDAPVKSSKVVIVAFPINKIHAWSNQQSVHLVASLLFVFHYNHTFTTMSNPNDDMGEYAKLGQSLVAPEGQLPTTSATVSTLFVEKRDATYFPQWWSKYLAQRIRFVGNISYREELRIGSPLSVTSLQWNYK